jgi:hypothetical protein
MNKPSFWGFIEARKGKLQPGMRRIFIRRLVRVYLRRKYPNVNFRVRESLAEDLETCERPDELLSTMESESIKAKMLQSLISKFASN